MKRTIHLTVETGAEKGQQLVIPAEGARVGRSSKNDITLQDPLLSRHHCRIFFKDDDMWVADLGSANKTYVNGKAIDEVRVQTGDIIALGDTTMKIHGASLTADTPSAPVDTTSPVFDLGLNAVPPVMPPPARKSRRDRLIVLLIAVAAIAVAGVVWTHMEKQAEDISRPPPDTTARLPSTIEIAYEKIDASPENVFRYKLTLDSNRLLTVQVDDIMNERKLLEETTLSERKQEDLIRSLHNAAFFTLKKDYVGFQPNILNQMDITLTLDRKTHRSVVRNRPEPEPFKAAREIIEVFGKTELGLWAIQFPREKLINMAQDAFDRAQRLYHQRDVKYGNLHAAIVSLKQAHMDLRSVEPKPNFYAESLTLLSDCTAMLQERFTEYNFRASRAMNLGQWEEAAEQLRVILEMIPDESDQRYRDTRTQLLEAENRQRTQR